MTAALASSAPAQTPPVHATPDFYATVFVAGFEHPVEVRQSGLKRRVDVATGAVVQSFVTDRTRGVLIVMTAAGKRRLAFIFPVAQEEVNAPLPLDFAEFAAAQRVTRMGGSNIAGRACALWRFVGYLGRSGVACVTADNLVLQIMPDGRKSPILQVLTLTTARQDQTWFQVPPEYQISVVPGAGGPRIAAPPAR